MSSPRHNKVDMSRVRVERRSIPPSESSQIAPRIESDESLVRETSLDRKCGVQNEKLTSDAPRPFKRLRPLATEIARMLADGPIRFPEILR